MDAEDSHKDTPGEVTEAISEVASEPKGILRKPGEKRTARGTLVMEHNETDPERTRDQQKKRKHLKRQDTTYVKEQPKDVIGMSLSSFFLSFFSSVSLLASWQALNISDSTFLTLLTADGAVEAADATPMGREKRRASNPMNKGAMKSGNSSSPSHASSSRNSGNGSTGNSGSTNTSFDKF